MIQAKDIKAGRIYYYRNETKVFLVLKTFNKKELYEEFGYVQVELLWLTGRSKGTFVSWHLYSDVSYNFEEIESFS